MTLLLRCNTRRNGVSKKCGAEFNYELGAGRLCGLTRPWNDPRKDIERKLAEQQPDLFLVGAIGEEIVASVMAAFDEYRGWVYYLVVEPKYRNRSYGRQLMQSIESRLRQRGCPKLNPQIRSSNAEVLAFYHRRAIAKTT